MNVQPHSGAQANQAAFFAVLTPGDRILGLRLDHGGHLTHGHPVSMSGTWFDAHHYGVDPSTERIDYDALERQAEEVRPKLLIAGASMYSRILDFVRLAAIAHGVGARLLVDMAHIAGLVAAGIHPSPFPHADLVTTTTHKTLRGPRGGLIFASPELATAVDRAVFPGFQGGPLMHVIAAKAVALRLAATRRVPRRPAANGGERADLAAEVTERGGQIIAGGTDTHLFSIDVRPLGATGREAERILDDVGITVNKNTIPFDPAPPNVTSGIRVGTPATTTRGFGPAEMRDVGRLLVEALPPRRAGRARPDPGRGARHLRPLPGPGPAGGVTAARPGTTW